jgi:hypothetical protein
MRDVFCYNAKENSVMFSESKSKEKWKNKAQISIIAVLQALLT